MINLQYSLEIDKIWNKIETTLKPLPTLQTIAKNELIPLTNIAHPQKRSFPFFSGFIPSQLTQHIEYTTNSLLTSGWPPIVQIYGCNSELKDHCRGLAGVSHPDLWVMFHKG